MATMNVSLPDSMKTWVEEQVAAGRYSSASDYVRDLIRRDQERFQPLAADGQETYPDSERAEGASSEQGASVHAERQEP